MQIAPAPNRQPRAKPLQRKKLVIWSTSWRSFIPIPGRGSPAGSGTCSPALTRRWSNRPRRPVWAPVQGVNNSHWRTDFLGLA